MTPTPTPRTDAMETDMSSDTLTIHCKFVQADFARQLERELEQERQDRQQADLDTIRALGERNDARAELERIQQKPTDDQACDPA